MKLTIKEQMVLMVYQDVYLSDSWVYLNFLVENGILNETRTINDCQRIINELKSQYLIKSEINLFKKPIDFNNIQSWANQAIMVGEKNYPDLWKELPQAPILFFYQGDLSILNKPLVSLFGTRKSSNYGEEVTSSLSRALVSKGFCLVADLSPGINSTSLTNALNTKPGSAVGIIPSGLGYYYPYRSRILQDRVSQEGLLISEFIPASQPSKENFIMVNRLIAGLSPASLLIEAPRESGSMITANYALQFNREVFALPGRITDISAQGCNDLIELGARPILSVEEAVNELIDLYQAQGFI